MPVTLLSLSVTRAAAVASVALLAVATACASGARSPVDPVPPTGVGSTSEPASGLTDTYVESLPEARNIILFIVDGGGFAHLEATRLFRVGRGGRLNIDFLPFQGQVATGPLGGGITDSAAAATAMATGQKVANGALSVTSDGSRLTTVLEQAAASGRATGVVVTSTVTHATPAAFYAHADDRNMQNEIAIQALENQVDVLLGGGLRHFIPSGQSAATGTGVECPSQRRDQRDLLAEAAEQGYTVVKDGASLAEAGSLPLIGLFACSNMAYDLERPSQEPALGDMAAKAISLLQADPDGFFLMVEGSRVDGAATDWDGTNMLGDFTAFDQAVGRALEFASGRDDTLVLVTADHETGGLELLTGLGGRGTRERGEQGFISQGPGAERFMLKWTVEGHTAQDVWVNALGPGAEIIGGVRDNTGLYQVMAGTLGVDTGPILLAEGPGPSATAVTATTTRIERVDPDCASPVERVPGAGNAVTLHEEGTLRIGVTGHTNLWWDGITRDGDSNSSRARQVTAFMDAQAVDMAVWLGDDLHLCQPAEVKAFTDALQGGVTPVFKVLGNHDLDDYHGDLANELQLGRFEALFGYPSYHYLDLAGFRLVFLADESASGASYVSSAQVEFLRQALATSSSPVVVFAHHVLPVRQQENLNAMIGAESKNTNALLQTVLNAGNVVLWVWNQQFSSGRDPVQRQGIIEYTPAFVTGYVDGQFIELLRTSIVTVKQRRITIETFDVKSGVLLQQFEFSIETES